MKILIVTIKSFHIANAEAFAACHPEVSVTIFSSKEQLTLPAVEALNPDWVFFPHWSWIIPSEIHTKYQCIGFHMTDLPFGRGGSPLQNLIVRGMTKTKLSAIRIVSELDAGPVYLKEDLDLFGTAQDILYRASGIIFDRMIPYILDKRPKPVPQTGEVESFKRRKPEDGNLKNCANINQVYDCIRMLDGEGYPNAFLKTENFNFTFWDAALIGKTITARVKIAPKEDS